MAITAVVDQGKIVNNGVPDSVKQSQESKANGVDEDMFLQLLVAEMKYQDPMQPTSNTEWISQYATFTQIEQSTAMQGSMKQMEAAQLVGKQVIMKSVNESTGETNFFSGVVDYMYVENGKVYLSVNNNLYSIDDLDTVVDPDYLEAVSAAQDFKTMIEKMPSIKNLTLQDEKLVTQLRETYDKLTDYQKKFVDDELVTKLKEYEARIKEIKPETDTENSAGKTEEVESDKTETDKTESSGSENGSEEKETTTKQQEGILWELIESKTSLPPLNK